MRLTGVEFFNYACFKRQFVPINRGLNLLVGKNNSGKTALLKGIAALAVLPMEDWPHVMQETRKFVNDLTVYVPERRGPKPWEQQTYDVKVHFELEQGDPLPLAGDATSWNPI